MICWQGQQICGGWIKWSTFGIRWIRSARALAFRSSARHLVTLALYIGFAALSCKLYKAADEKKRAQLWGLFAVLLLADEAFKQIGLQIGGNFNWDYLPLHLCSINIFLIALYAWKPSRLLDNFLYLSLIHISEPTRP